MGGLQTKIDKNQLYVHNQQEELNAPACDISDDRSPVRIFVREILDHNAPPNMDLETGQHLTRKVRKQYLSFFSFCFFARSREASTIYLSNTLLALCTL